MRDAFVIRGMPNRLIALVKQQCETNDKERECYEGAGGVNPMVYFNDALLLALRILKKQG
jgi:hypothetical protein